MSNKSRRVDPYDQGSAPAGAVPSSLKRQPNPTQRFIFSSPAHKRPFADATQSKQAKVTETRGTKRRDSVSDDIDDGEWQEEKWGEADASQLAGPPAQATYGAALRASDSIEESEMEISESEATLLDSIETDPAESNPRNSAISTEQHGRPRRQKRRRPSSSPPPTTPLRTRIAPGRQAVVRSKPSLAEPITISSSPPASPLTDDKEEEGEEEVEGNLTVEDSDDSLDLMPAPVRPSRSKQPRPPPRHVHDAEIPLPGPPTPSQTDTETRAHSPPRTPMVRSTPTAPRFQFTNSRHQTQQPPQTPRTRLNQGGRESEGWSTPARPMPSSSSTSQHANQFILPFSSTAGREGGVSESGSGGRAEARVDHSLQLPELFSPQKRGSRFVPGGLAASVRDMVLEAGGAMHVAATRRVRVLEAKLIGRNGAILALVEPDEGGDSDRTERLGRYGADTIGDVASQQQRRQHGQGTAGGEGKSMSADVRRGNNDSEQYGFPEGKKYAGHDGSRADEKAAAVGPKAKRMLLVGADEVVSRRVRPGQVIKIRHGWDLQLDLRDTLSHQAGADAIAGARTLPSTNMTDDETSSVEVCWGPIT